MRERAGRLLVPEARTPEPPAAGKPECRSGEPAKQGRAERHLPIRARGSTGWTGRAARYDSGLKAHKRIRPAPRCLAPLPAWNTGRASHLVPGPVRLSKSHWAGERQVALARLLARHRVRSLLNHARYETRQRFTKGMISSSPFVRHREPGYSSRLTSRGVLSSRSPINRECLRWASGVHSTYSNCPTRTG